MNRKAREARERNPEAARVRGLRYARKLHGFDDEMVARLFEEQGGRCAICQVPFTEGPHGDHDHTTGAPRGLLCRACNQGIGQLGDDPQRLLAAAAYLDKYAALREKRDVAAAVVDALRKRKRGRK